MATSLAALGKDARIVAGSEPRIQALSHSEARRLLAFTLGKPTSQAISAAREFVKRSRNAGHVPAEPRPRTVHPPPYSRQRAHSFLDWPASARASWHLRGQDRNRRRPQSIVTSIVSKPLSRPAARLFQYPCPRRRVDRRRCALDAMSLNAGEKTSSQPAMCSFALSSEQMERATLKPAKFGVLNKRRHFPFARTVPTRGAESEGRIARSRQQDAERPCSRKADHKGSGGICAYPGRHPVTLRAMPPGPRRIRICGRFNAAWSGPSAWQDRP